jgi:hypothetical protein
MLRVFASSLTLSAALLVLLPAASSFAQDPVGADAVQKPRLQEMLAAGDEGMIVATFKRHPNATLPFIDSFLEGGLAILEKGSKEGGTPSTEAKGEAAQSFRMGVRFAKLADQAFGGTDFSEYANAFASWSPSEQKAFRQGQQLFRQGMKLAKTDATKAIEALESSQRLAESLADTWGQAMAYGALADLYLAQAESQTKAGGKGELGEAAEGLLAKADQAARAAVTLNRKVRLDEDRVAALSTAAKVIKAVGGKAESRATPLQEAWSLIRRHQGMSAELRKSVADDLVAAFEELKRPDAAAEVRRELEESNAPGEAKGESGAAPAKP